MLAVMFEALYFWPSNSGNTSMTLIIYVWRHCKGLVCSAMTFIIPHPVWMLILDWKNLSSPIQYSVRSSSMDISTSPFDNSKEYLLHFWSRTNISMVDIEQSQSFCTIQWAPTNMVHDICAYKHDS